MADPNIQSIPFNMMTPFKDVNGKPASGTFKVDINKQTGAMVVSGQNALDPTKWIPVLRSEKSTNWDPRPTNPTAWSNYDPKIRQFYIDGVMKNANAKRSTFINNSYTQNQKNNLFPGVPGVTNTASPTQTPPGTKPTSPGTPDPTPVPIADSIPGAVDQQKVDYGTWKYPTKIGENKQDYILFEMYEYSGRGDLSTFDPKKGLSRMTFNTNILGRVFLPLQPTISDINTVDWQNDTINPLQLLGAQLSLKGMQSGYTEADFAKLKTMFADNPTVQSYLQQWFAGKAVGTNIFSRFSGAVVNPNLELLFNGPQLRPFNFSFRLSPRDKDEAKQVKGIIRFFKQGMSVRRTQGDLFLKAPNIFKITYINGQNSKDHTSLNKIKFCSLTQCGVDYTPDGSYATFYDKESTMTQYGLTLQFNELEPIYDTDYEDLTDKSTIGY